MITERVEAYCCLVESPLSVPLKNPPKKPPREATGGVLRFVEYTNLEVLGPNWKADLWIKAEGRWDLREEEEASKERRNL